LPPIASYAKYRYLYERGSNDAEIAKKIVKKEVEELRGNYFIVAGKTAPVVFYDILKAGKYRDKLNKVDVRIVFGKKLKFEMEEEKDAFVSFLKNGRVKYTMMEDTPPHHFRICDDGYVYVEKKHGENDVNRMYDIYRDGKVVSSYVEVFNKALENAGIENADTNNIEWTKV
jgi:hypothetical protein